MEKEELESMLWTTAMTAVDKMAQGKEVCPKRFVGMLCVIDILIDRFDLGIKIDGFKEVLAELGDE